MDAAKLIIQISIGGIMALFGITQVIRPDGWISYLPSGFSHFNPLDDRAFMRLHGLGNIVLGAWLLSGLVPVIAAWVCLVWWVSLLPFVFRFDWRDGCRDLVIIGALAAYLVML